MSAIGGGTLQDILDAEQESGSDQPDRQILFEGAALAILAHILEGQIRIDLAVADYLSVFSIGADESHIRPDLIICVSDCHGLLLRAAGGHRERARLVLDDATRAWRDTGAAERLDAKWGITRIQACIGNIRRAIGPIA